MPKLGVVAVALLAAGAMLSPQRARRAWSMLGALLLSPVLLLASIWSSQQLGIVHRHPLEAAIGGGVALVAVCLVAVVLARRPWLLGPLTMIALPFRVPISTGNGTSSNLLVPLYFVIAAAALAWIVSTLRDDRPRETQQSGGWMVRLLAASLVLYAFQAIYSDDFEKALQQMVFFYVPFALLLTLLWELEWDRALLGRCLKVTVALALVFSCIGFVEYETKHLLLNPKVIFNNQVHTYFTVNSVFFDPDIFGRYLALVMILVAGVLLFDDARRTQLGATAVLAVLWGGLVLSLSRSSLAALLLGLATLAAARWKVRPVLILGAAVLAIGAVALAASPKTFGLNQGLNGFSSGRASLVTGGLRLFADRPIQGYGSASFVTEYKRHYPRQAAGVSASHTIPITVAAEQGVIGELVYIPLVIVSLLTLFSGARRDPPRIALAAALFALVFHTMLYADFLEDPVTWTLLGIGGALAAARNRGAPAEEPRPPLSARERYRRRRLAREARAAV
jgi:O-antigen ligase